MWFLDTRVWLLTSFGAKILTVTFTHKASMIRGPMSGIQRHEIQGLTPDNFDPYDAPCSPQRQPLPSIGKNLK